MKKGLFLLLGLSLFSLRSFADQYDILDFLFKQNQVYLVFHDTYSIDGRIVPIGSEFVVEKMTMPPTPQSRDGEENRVTISGVKGTFEFTCRFDKSSMLEALKGEFVGRVTCPYKFKILRIYN